MSRLCVHKQRWVNACLKTKKRKLLTSSVLSMRALGIKHWKTQQFITWISLIFYILWCSPAFCIMQLQHHWYKWKLHFNPKYKANYCYGVYVFHTIIFVCVMVMNRYSSDQVCNVLCAANCMISYRISITTSI